MIALKISTFILILLLVFCLGALYSPIVLIIDWIKKKRGKNDYE